MTPLSSRHDPKAEREPPPLPTPVTFPQYGQIKLHPRLAIPKSNPSLRDRLAQLKTPLDANTDLLDALNIEILPVSQSVEIFPLADHHLPPSSWLNLLDDVEIFVPHLKLVISADSTAGSSRERLLGTGRPYPSKGVFAARLKEICFNNEDAFGTLSRTPTANGVPCRLAHFRRFWEGLDSMAYYWDTSLDDYVSSPAEQKIIAAHRLESNDVVGSSETTAIHEDGPRKRLKTTPSPTPASNPLVCADNKVEADTLIPENPCGQQPEIISPSGRKYKGQRTGNGASMPELFRSNTVKAFVEPIAWCFGCNIEARRRTPLLAVDRLMMPTKLSYAIWRAPSDVNRARLGFLEGPIMGVQCREHVKFCREGPQVEAEAALDLLTEISVLLTIAEERAREGATENRPGDGKWWTQKLRWGGSAGIETGDGSVDGDELSDANQNKSSSGDPKDSLSTATASKYQKLATRRRAIALRAWKKLSPGSGYWDPRVTYEQIGKNKCSSYDEVSCWLFIT